MFVFLCVSLPTIQMVITFKLERLVKSVARVGVDWLHSGGVEAPVRDSHTLYGKQRSCTVSYVD